jgi:hypothetical protein
MSTTLNQLVRDQILAEGPQIVNGREAVENYINAQLRYMPHSELLERISDALAVIQSEQSVRLGL